MIQIHLIHLSYNVCDFCLFLANCIVKHKQKEKQKEKQKQKEETSQPFSLIMYSRRILFTYKSPFINGSVDITEYDRVYKI